MEIRSSWKFFERENKLRDSTNLETKVLRILDLFLRTLLELQLISFIHVSIESYIRIK